MTFCFARMATRGRRMSTPVHPGQNKLFNHEGAASKIEQHSKKNTAQKNIPYTRQDFLREGDEMEVESSGIKRKMESQDGKNANKVNKSKKVKPEQQKEYRESDTSMDHFNIGEDEEPFEAYDQIIHENHDISHKSTKTLRSPIQKPDNEKEPEREQAEKSQQKFALDKPKQRKNDSDKETTSNNEHAEHVAFEQRGINNNMQQRKLESEYIVYAKGKHVDITKLRVMDMKREIEEAVGRKIIITKAGDSIRIICKNEKERRTVNALNSLAGNDVTMTPPRSLTRPPAFVRGIIFGISEEYSEEDIAYETGASKVQRIHKLIAGKKIPTAQMILFYPDYLPDIVYCGFKRCRVREYIPEPIRCYNCQRFGHKAAVCHSKKSICSKCAGNHEVKECPTITSETENDTPRCANCDGAHPTSYGGCPAYKRAKEIVKIQTTEKLSYAQAVGVHKAKTASENKNARNRQPPAPSNAAEKTQSPTPRNDESKDRPNRDTATPNQEGSTNNPTGQSELSHSNCISKHYLVDFISAIASILKEDKPKDVLIETLFKLCQNLNSKIHEKPTEAAQTREDPPTATTRL